MYTAREFKEHTDITMFSRNSSNLVSADFCYGNLWVPEDACYVKYIGKSGHDIVCNFLHTLSVHGERSGIVTEQFCVELEQYLIKTKSLPPSTAGLTVELSLLYNLLYASYIKARCSQQSGASILSSQAQSVLLSLDRVQQVIGADQIENKDERGDAKHLVKQVSSMLSSLVPTLCGLNNRELVEPVGLVACMWSLVTLLEKGTSVPLPWLSAVKNWEGAEQLTVLKHGFLLVNPHPPANLTEGKVPSCGEVRSLAHLILAVSCFGLEKWAECREWASRISHTQWKSFATLLTARAMLAEENSLEAAEVLHAALNTASETTSPNVVSYVFQLLAACYSAQNLPHLSVEMLRRTLHIKPDCTTALLRLAKLFQSLQQVSAEMECLQALVKAAENDHKASKCKQSRPLLLNDFLQEVVIHEQRVTLSQALYYLASRSAQLNRFEDASQAYTRLIAIYENTKYCDSTKGQQVNVQLPDLLTVCREAAQVLLEIPQHKQCLQMCDKILGAISSSSLSHKLPSPLVNCATDTQDQTLMDNSVTVHDGNVTSSQADCSVTAQRDLVSKFTQGRKRQLSSADIDDDFLVEEEQKREWKDEENRVLLLVCKAECLGMEGDHMAAARVLNSAFQRLMEYWQAVPSAESVSCWGVTVSALNPKRPRYSVSEDKRSEFQQQQSAKSTEAAGEEETWTRLSQQVCLCLCDALCRCGAQGQALRFARLAAQAKPEKEEAQYYLTSSLSQMGRGGNECQAWLRLRRLPHNTGSVRLQSSIQQRKEMIRALPKDNEASQARRLGTVTEAEKLQLDLVCLQSFAESRLKK